jgi:poly(A) polymerase
LHTPLIDQIKNWLKPDKPPAANIIARHHHKLSRKLVSANALKVLYCLNKAGYAAYLVGGGVRDLLLKQKPKDFDIATDAHPEEVRDLFRNSRIIGRRFRLVHVHYYDEIIEVSTFRSSQQKVLKEATLEKTDSPPVMVKYDNSYGTIEEDAWRRDFTVNALYYNIEDFSIVDFTNGMMDIKKRYIRMIGEPVARYHEDPVRLLRAIRLSAKLNFNIATDTEAPLAELAPLLEHVPSSRLYEEVLKLFFKGHATATYEKLKHYGYMQVLFPSSEQALRQSNSDHNQRFIELAIHATDSRYNKGQSINPGFLLAILLWPAVELQIEEEKKQHEHFFQQIHAAIETVLREQNNTLMIPKRLKSMMRSVWLLQYHLINRRAKRVHRSIAHRYFRAAYDFLELKVKAGDTHQDAYQWWKRFQSAKAAEREQMLSQLNPHKKRRKH